MFAEGEQVGVDLVFEGGAHPVGCALVNLKLGAFDDPGGEHAGGGDGDNLVVVAVEDEGGDVELLQVLGAVGQ